MQISFDNQSTVLRGVAQFEPAHIFENGQAFRFSRTETGDYEGVALGRYLRVSKREETVTLFPTGEGDYREIWEEYFDLKRDYGRLFCENRDPALQCGIRYGEGLRVLNQPPFETLISFIISANNNLKRIKSIVERVCALCGTPFSAEGRTFYRFPEPRQLAALTEKDLTACGCGYRAPYILKSAREVEAGFDLFAVGDLPYAQAKRELCRLPGVGPKVADCVLLFALRKTDAFPADVWIRRVMERVYGFTGNDRQLYEFAREKFGPCAGIAQQYLFYYARETMPR